MVMVVAVAMGLIAPPIGLNACTVRVAMPDIRLGEFFRGVMAFVYAVFVALALVIMFPILAVGLVDLLR